jgi:phosphoserine phosphatase RsbU/P
MVAGDYFDYIQLQDQHLGLVVADVSGKGASAALIMSSVEVALRIDASTESRPDQVLASLNKVLCQVTEAERYVTIFYAKLDPSRRILQYTNAGHLPALIFREGSVAAEPLQGVGFPIGMFADAEYVSSETYLRPNDVLVMYTDGITEAASAAGEQFGIERLSAVIRENIGRSANLLVNAIMRAVEEFQASREAEDDQTVVIIKGVVQRV